MDTQVEMLLQEREELTLLGLQPPVLDQSALAGCEQTEGKTTPGQFERYMRECSAVEGWLSQEMVGIWDCLLSYQKDHNIRGHLFEIGVMKGRSAALLAMHAAPDEALVLVDPNPMADASAVLASIKADNVRYLQVRSQELAGSPALEELLSKCRWIHIDGEHSEHALINDLEVATSLLSESGVIAIDAFMSAGYPQTTRATFQYLESHSADLSLFLCGLNKAYLCRPAAKYSYLSYLKERAFSDMAARGCASITFFKTNTPEELNCFGIAPRFMHFDYYGLDDDLAAIVIK